MSEVLNLNVRLKGALRDHVAKELDTGTYDNVSEYVRALIRRDQQHAQQRAFETLKAELRIAYDEPQSAYVTVTADDIFERNAHLTK